nr:MAG TPA: hypothetical protein [Caudoviricetes sp.]
MHLKSRLHITFVGGFLSTQHIFRRRIYHPTVAS